MAVICGAEADQALLRYIEEVVWGEIPGAGNMQEIRFTDADLGLDKSTTDSAEIRSDRQLVDLITTKKEASGGFNGEFSFGTYDDFIEAALFNPRVNIDFTDSGDTTVSGTDTFDFTGTVPAGELVIGQSFLMADMNLAANNGIFTIVSFIEGAGGSITVAETLTDDATTGFNGHVTALLFTNGVLQKSYYIEEDFTDAVQVIGFKGMVLGTFTINMDDETIITIGLVFLGKNVVTGTSSQGPGTPLAPTTTEVMNSGDNIPVIKEGGVTVGLVKNLSLDIANNLRGKSAVGNIDNICIGQGKILPTGTFTIYFEDFLLYQKFLDNSATSLSWTLTDSNGSYIFNLPRVKLAAAPITISGSNSDIMVEATFNAMLDPVSGKTIIITKI